MATPASPSSSPRIPSPPPLAEVQEPPTSPGLGSYEDNTNILGANSIDAGAGRRIRPGTKREDMAEGPPLVELQEIDSAFQLTEHLKALHYHHTHPPSSTTVHPITASLARDFSHPPPNTSKEIWLYELARFLIQKTNAIIVHLFADDPPCSPATCPEMRASEWQYLCAVHDPPKSCSAIDYCCHTLDWAATSLTSSKMFPSRLGLGSGNVGGGGSDKMLQQQMKEITNIFRRVYRIYAHAWFQHRDMFWRVEESTGLYIFFKTVCDEYGMIQPENYTIPLEAEGGGPATDDQVQERAPLPPMILRPEGSEGKGESAGSKGLSRGDTTKRHTRIPSNMAPLATVIQEEAEDEDETKHSLDRQITAVTAESLTKDDAKDEPKHGNAPEAFPEFETEVSNKALKQENESASEPSIIEVTPVDNKAQVDPAEDEEDADVTVVEAEPEAERNSSGVEIKVEAVEVEDEESVETAPGVVADPEAKAGDAAEAGKSVAD
ncbi:unnamed protein product [Zymoseptoria tritici ST99CH_1A5]|uniref:Mob1/phocein n=4 Tax=Zymoseptoria tritici TaxID=1047171 RepID=F9XAZ6_ZYMTI|nr:uncharacterized protein MYCGRDRAFT_72326 [Zymoseptoria tritici IPO323]SMQ50983.1 unnamed protein product [Zymoseptoria tritici ST99CH_3D7]SMR52902.1 unnamed protein product [Zymoseptoria tritici ST99CH_1E4]SMR54330.1 unnamed protein product [Zymoseptoria tritici ST99CH_3D1]SMY24647.1 unnamed protein product [Zymoseptoria tritici ST99CH_1A5]EGP87538.1 hypothetical protein MYCGRDRAFT_72326 [Zymoseptoria tritici IPO323]